MEREYCTYNVATKLGELGYDKKCFGWFNTERFNYMVETSLDVGAFLNEKDYQFFKFYHKQHKYMPTPLWQQAIEWFRTKHMFEVNVTIIWKNIAVGYTEIDCYLPYCNGIIFDIEYDTFEEAREVAILIAIERLETNKKNENTRRNDIS